MIISKERYFYHKKDIEDIEDKPEPLNGIDKIRLTYMKKFVAEFLKANPSEVKKG